MFGNLMLRVKVAAVLAVLAVLAGEICSAQESAPLWGGLAAGPYAVGFRTLFALDSTRTIGPHGNVRPVQIGIWYPTRINPANPRMQYEDYVALSAGESAASPNRAEGDTSIAGYRRMLSENGIQERLVDQWLATPCAAHRDADPGRGPFPLILVAQGNFHSLQHQSPLCEYLAGHGYVVISTPSQARIGGGMTSDADVYPQALDQSLDLLFAKQQVKNFSWVDTVSTGIVAHSFGARSALLVALREPSLRAIVSLDGGIANKNGKEWVRDIPNLHPESLQAPVLHFYEDVEPTMLPDFDLLKSLTNSFRTLIKVDNMHHVYFSSFGNVAAVIPELGGQQDPLLKEKVTAVDQLTLDFLDAYVRKLPNGRELFRKDVDDSARPFLSVQTFPPQR